MNAIKNNTMISYELTKNKRIKVDILIMLIIVVSPFLFFTYNLAPSAQKWETTFFTIDAGLFEEVDFYLWHFFIKILTLIILIIWFLTCVYKWKYVLLVPVFLEINKIVFIAIESRIDLRPNAISISEYSLFIAIPVFLLLLYTNKIIGYDKSSKSISKKINEEITNEHIKLSSFDIKVYNEVKKELTQLENQYSTKHDKKEYLAKLINLRDRLCSL